MINLELDRLESGDQARVALRVENQLSEQRLVKNPAEGWRKK